MPVPVSQGSTVSFGGVPIGLLTSIRVSPAQAVIEDATNVTSPVWGAGGSARVVRQYQCVAVDPGTVEVGIYGAPQFVLLDIGATGSLAVDVEGGGITAEAVLESFDVTATVGETLVGSARFRFTGYEDFNGS